MQRPVCLALALLLAQQLPRAARAQGGYALTSTCPTGIGSFYSLTVGALSACCPAPGSAVVSSSLGCAPDASMGGPTDTKFFFSGYAAEGAAGFAVTGAAPTFVADRYNVPARALALAVGTNLDTTGAAIAANMPSGGGAMSASAWLRCNATAVGASAAVVSFGAPAAAASATRFGVLVSSPTIAGPLASYVTGAAALRNAAGAPPSDANIPLNGPYGVGADPVNQLLYVADTGNNRIRVANLATGLLSAVAGGGLTGTAAATAALGYSDGTGTNALCAGPRGVILGPDGALYVADSGKGSNRVRRCTTAGVVTTISGSAGGAVKVLDGVGTAASHYQPAALAFDSAGLLYSVDYNGNSIRMINLATLAVTTIAGMGVNSQTAIGNVGQVCTPPTCTVGWADGIGTNANFCGPTGITFTSTFGPALYVAEFAYGKVRKIDLSPGPTQYTVSTVTGFFPPNSIPTTAGWAIDGNLSTAQMQSAWQMSSDSTGALYVTEYNVNTIRKVDIANNLVTTIAGPSPCTTGNCFVAAQCGTLTPSASSTCGTGALVDSPVGTSARFNGLRAMAFVAPNSLYVAEAANNRIRQISLTGTNAVTSFAGASVTFADGAGSSAILSGPRGGVMDAAKLNLFFVDTGNFRVRSFNVATNTVSTVAGGATSAFADGPGLAGALFQTPSAITIDPASGALYVADAAAAAARIRVLTPQGGGLYTATTLAGGAAVGFVDSAVGTSARFSNPYGIGFAQGGTLLVADYTNNAVRQVVVASGAVTTWAGSTTGVAGFADGLGTNAAFNAPRGIAVLPDGSAFVTEYLGNHIRRISATGAVTTVAGTSGAGVACTTGATNGVGTNAKLCAPAGIALDAAAVASNGASGTAYIVETTGCRVRKMDLASLLVTNVAGSLISSSCSVIAPSNAAGTSATFNQPLGIAYDDTSAQVFIFDSPNALIRAISVQPNPLPICDGKWHNAAVVSTGTTTSAYVDGVLVGTPAAIKYNVPSGSAVRIGWGGDASVQAGERFTGVLGDVRVFGRALSSAEVLALALPALPSYTGAVNPAAVLGATNYSWTCPAGAAGPLTSYAQSAADLSWSISSGGVGGTSCTTCSVNTAAVVGTGCIACPASSSSAAGAATCTCAANCEDLGGRCCARARCCSCCSGRAPRTRPLAGRRSSPWTRFLRPALSLTISHAPLPSAPSPLRAVIPNGQAGAAFACLACPTGATASSGDSSCVCSANYVSTGSGASLTCTCPSGFATGGSGPTQTCFAPCVAGTYSVVSGGTCVACPPNGVSAAGARSCTCGANSTGNGLSGAALVCTACPSNAISLGGSSACSCLGFWDSYDPVNNVCVTPPSATASVTPSPTSSPTSTVSITPSNTGSNSPSLTRTPSRESQPHAGSPRPARS